MFVGSPPFRCVCVCVCVRIMFPVTDIFYDIGYVKLQTVVRLLLIIKRNTATRVGTQSFVFRINKNADVTFFLMI